jgi:hypothetical protein
MARLPRFCLIYHTAWQGAYIVGDNRIAHLRAKIDCGIVRLSALAVFKSIMSFTLAICSIGR